MRLVDPEKYQRRLLIARSCWHVLTMLWYSIPAFGQKPEYEFYFEFRTVFEEKVQEENHWSLTNEQVFEKYAAKLKNDGIAESEIARRLKLLRTEHAL